ncbi:glyoxalase/bleomycin resistance protein/dioxygenase [Devosia epidermidihirudinis]|uniref:Glyoxalase/bleomycin resistance protein/dioxygenase n=1 Tax=Devosia epidermidihirudinis TaxID=1293439 RepID=A0A0F5Q6S0_9HYPH|nr:VOC family protein [Devosia epidermidihirudinis]KKC36637.1 glyoxalase/bleomycin resistance protein/dioxygenase [Devosia epidermidihirudinis]
MTIQTTTHLNFRGDARAALSFYQTVFGGDVMVFTYRDTGNIKNEAEADQVTFGQVASPDGFRIMAYDVPSSMDWNPGTIPVFVSVRGADAAEITRYWEKLIDGATIVQPLAPSGWAPLYGMVKDKFGITWVLDVQAAY